MVDYEGNRKEFLSKTDYLEQKVTVEGRLFSGTVKVVFGDSRVKKKKERVWDGPR